MGQTRIKADKLMGRIFYFILIFAGLTFLSACNNPQPEAPRLLAEAERLMEVYPDSAMRLIDSLFYPEKSLDRKSYMRFLVRQVQAKYKINRPIYGDTLVFNARDYFSSRNKNPQLTTLAYFYSGCVYRERKEYEGAMQQYIEAEKYASQTGDISLKGLVQYNMGDLIASQGLYSKAIEHYKNAEHLYAESPEELYEKQATSLSAIGRMFLLSGESDSAFQYLHAGLKIAESKNDTKIQSLLSQNLSVAHRENKQYEQAEKYLRQSFQFDLGSIEIPRYYLNLARLYAQQGQKDSVVFYANKLVQSIDSIDNGTLKASAFEFLASVEKENGNYETALDYNRKYTNVLIEIMNERNRQSIYEVQQKYNFELQQKQSDNRFTKAERFITALIIVILIGALTFSLYTFQQRKKHILALQKINTLQNMADRLHSNHESEADRKIRSLMMDKFETVKKVALLNNSIKENDSTKKILDKLNEIVYGKNFEEEWVAIFRVFNEINPGISDGIQHRFPQLTKNEFRVFILSYAKFNPKEISVVLNLTYASVLTLRSSIRKKIKMNGSELEDSLYI